MVRTNQGGSMINFLVIGGAMALLLIGGAYAVRRNFGPADRSPQVAVSDNDNEPTKDEAENSQKPTESEEEKKDQPDTAQGDSGNDTNAQNPDTLVPAPVTTGQPAGNLPETGPSDMLLGSVMLSTLTAMLVAYVQSRRPNGTL